MRFSMVRSVLDLLPPRSRRRLALLLALFTATALTEVSSVTSVLPLVMSATDAVGSASNPWVSVVSRVTGVTDPGAVTALLGVLFVTLYALATALTAYTWYACLTFCADLSRRLSTALLRSYLHRPLSWFFSHNTTELLRRSLSDSRNVVDNVVRPLVRGISQTLTVVAVCVALLAIDFRVAMLSAIGVTVLYLAIYRLFAGTIDALGRRAVDHDATRHRLAAESLAVFRGARVGPRREVFVRRFDARNQAFFEAAALHNAICEVPRYVTEIVAVGGIVAIFGFLLWSGRSPSAAVSLMCMYIVAVWRVVPALQRVYSNVIEIGYHRVALDNLRAELFDAAHIRSEEDPVRLSLTRAIALRGVGLRYEGRETDALEAIDLEIARGTRMAFVGPTGCGKSTLADVITGYLPPTSGAVEIDGAPLSDPAVDAWQRNVGVVAQDVLIVDDTVTRNVALGVDDEDIDIDAVRRACQQARVADVIETLAQGYDTLLGERGVSLSGGQRQRIGIARALYHDPEVLVLDEATSALDGRVEREIVEAVESLSPRKTVIVIAHRLSTVERCDEIVLLDEGRITARGTFAELLATSPLMRALASAGRPEGVA
ncbi:MAG: ABC transporter ATP-binding protein [Proteobacteria bacterium]|nr:ABC transporter ATP-binding protein [Pseudomonadota bacterium]